MTTAGCPGLRRSILIWVVSDIAPRRFWVCFLVGSSLFGRVVVQSVACYALLLAVVRLAGFSALGKGDASAK
eukprot:778625-Lingulodinium_polyedra.AAC.1